MIQMRTDHLDRVVTVRGSTPRLAIPVATGVGTGPTELAAFDAALIATGVANFNLLRLSSVIPPGSVVTAVDGPVAPAGGWGDRLYVVMAERRTSRPGSTVAAGIGWVQHPEHGHGLFVEHEAETEEQVRADIAATLGALTSARSMDGFRTREVLTSARCEGTPTCALAVAVFEAEPWRGTDLDLR